MWTLDVLNSPPSGDGFSNKPDITFTGASRKCFLQRVFHGNDYESLIQDSERLFFLLRINSPKNSGVIRKSILEDGEDIILRNFQPKIILQIMAKDQILPILFVHRNG